jgi:hypothetical protein
MSADRRVTRSRRDPERRYADRRQSPAFRALVDDLLQRGEIEIVETLWGRELRRVSPPRSAGRSFGGADGDGSA